MKEKKEIMEKFGVDESQLDLDNFVAEDEEADSTEEVGIDG